MCAKEADSLTRLFNFFISGNTLLSVPNYETFLSLIIGPSHERRKGGKFMEYGHC